MNVCLHLKGVEIIGEILALAVKANTLQPVVAVKGLEAHPVVSRVLRLPQVYHLVVLHHRVASIQMVGYALFVGEDTSEKRYAGESLPAEKGIHQRRHVLNPARALCFYYGCEQVHCNGLFLKTFVILLCLRQPSLNVLDTLCITRVRTEP